MIDTGAHSFDAIAMHDDDSVATVIQSLKSGTEILVQGSGAIKNLNLRDDIPLCHKVSIKVIEEGDEVLKNGQVIGHATRYIPLGLHVHIHNLVGRDPSDCLNK